MGSTLQFGFLSCLHGSELFMHNHIRQLVFLSCLHGSELFLFFDGR